MATTDPAIAVAAPLPSHKTADAKEKERSCTVCTESGIPLIRPCRFCHSDYCDDCLGNMFIAATKDPTRMPPRCCHFLQIHTAIAELSKAQADAYRAKFEEWLAPVRTYCPSPPCSAFISEKILLALEPSPAPDTRATLTDLLQGVLHVVFQSPTSRFFRGEVQASQLPGYDAIVKEPMYAAIANHDGNTAGTLLKKYADAALAIDRHLDQVQTKLDAGEYDTIERFKDDIELIVANSRNYNGLHHPITKEAEKFFSAFTTELAVVTQRLVTTPAQAPLTVPRWFPCPRCHVAICTKCKKIEHSDSPCSSGADDDELAMLKQFGYKQCPRCNSAVIRMRGCSHMECRCGAHWCWRCQRPIMQCEGQCEDDLSAGEEESQNDDLPIQHDLNGEVITRNDMQAALSQEGEAAAAAQQHITPLSAGEQIPLTMTSSIPFPTSMASAPTPLINLDAGSEERWRDGEEDFGEEPVDNGREQHWSCEHAFETFKPFTVEYRHGDLSKMECNRCFKHVEMKKLETKPLSVTKRKRKLGALIPGRQSVVLDEGKGAMVVESVNVEKEAWHCPECQLLVCVDCKGRYMKEVRERQEREEEMD